MKRCRNYFFSTCFFLLAAITVPSITRAQGDPPDPGCDPLDPACPIDGGIGLLIAAGIGMAAKKTYKMKKTS